MSLLLTVLKGTDILTFNGKFTTNKKDISTYLFLMVTKEQGYFEVFIFDDKCESKEQGRLMISVNQRSKGVSISLLW